VLALAGALVLAGCTGCGFAASGDRGSSKPDPFLLRGYVSVGGVSVGGVAAGPAGSPCVPPPGSDDIRAGGAVRVADPQGRTLAAGVLTVGVLAVANGDTRCNLAFEIPGVPGGVDRYVIGVGTRPPVSFAARDLRENKPAVLTIDP
jgi:hypothetical protein